MLSDAALAVVKEAAFIKRKTVMSYLRSMRMQEDVTSLLDALL